MATQVQRIATRKISGRAFKFYMATSADAQNTGTRSRLKRR